MRNSPSEFQMAECSWICYSTLLWTYLRNPMSLATQIHEIELCCPEWWTWSRVGSSVWPPSTDSLSSYEFRSVCWIYQPSFPVPLTIHRFLFETKHLGFLTRMGILTVPGCFQIQLSQWMKNIQYSRQCLNSWILAELRGSAQDEKYWIQWLGLVCACRVPFLEFVKLNWENWAGLWRA